MIYQVTATLLFDIENEAVDFYHDCQLALAKSTFINPDEPNLEFGTIQLLLSNHELHPPEPSVLLESNDNKPPEPD